MACPGHTFGPECRLAPVLHPPNDRGSPPVDAQFFYSSLIPIDDPLSTGSATSNPDPRSAKRQFRPFSRGDSNELEKAWLTLLSPQLHLQHQDAMLGRDPAPSATKDTVTAKARLVQGLALRHLEKHAAGLPPQQHSPKAMRDAFVPCCTELLMGVSEALQHEFCSLVRRCTSALSIEEVAQDVVEAMDTLRKPAVADAAQSIPAAAASSQKPSGKENDRRRRSPDDLNDTHPRPRSGSQLTLSSSRTQTPTSVQAPSRNLHEDDGILGMPFIRVGSLGAQMPTTSSPQQAQAPAPGRVAAHQNDTHAVPRGTGAAFLEHMDQSNTDHHGIRSTDVVVGVSRLHKVSLPLLQMKPIYWSPVNDIAVVMRATWFYRDTMLPVAPGVANQLEAGYRELRPWTETWSDEIRCAIEVGPLGEEKVSHWLWPQDSNQPYVRKMDGDPVPHISSDPFCAARCFQGEAASQGSIDPIVGGPAIVMEPPNRPFAHYHVIYKDGRQAFLLKPSLKPSAYYGRRPVHKIMKGVNVGIAVIRGFDRLAWDRIHEKSQVSSGKSDRPAVQDIHEDGCSGVCAACKAGVDRAQVTDLVLVAHGIGQKFAERVESFHFTHAINGFRRAVNMEMGNPIVRQVLRSDRNGLMILPLNWRTGLSFEDGGPLREADRVEHAADKFALKDIEPDTIPAIRNMISDVMFDIPFYMSHHKNKMINALVSEANRVYRLWCRNNPGFAEAGRVHIIAHSLGSAMALEILSRQPTYAPKMDLARQEPETRFLEFDTRNLFLLGSPAGFFLLLEHGTLMPRRGRRKPGADLGDATAKSVVGEMGSLGCLAVDNIYNILAKDDPIAYLLNGAVDAAYSTSLKVAYVPSTSTSVLKSVSDAVRHIVPGLSSTSHPLATEPERPSTVRLPSQLELEVHDFTREEIAEKKAFLLNDNGQIDWFLRSGGGPLEIQYLNMLSAHTSYWTNQDFIRMLCIETGRKPGRANTVPAMRAVKTTKRFSPSK